MHPAKRDKSKTITTRYWKVDFDSTQKPASPHETSATPVRRTIFELTNAGFAHMLNSAGTVPSTVECFYHSDALQMAKSVLTLTATLDSCLPGCLELLPALDLLLRFRPMWTLPKEPCPKTCPSSNSLNTCKNAGSDLLHAIKRTASQNPCSNADQLKLNVYTVHNLHFPLRSKA